MKIIILYESEEWSTYALRDNIEKLGVPAELVNMEQEIRSEIFDDCDLVVNRVFASAQFRGHEKSLKQMEEVLELLKKRHIPMVNPYRAHFYEINKELSTNTLRENGISVPEVYGTFHKESVWKLSLKYPCIIKPNCGGRTTCTYIIQDRHELEQVIQEIPDIEMIAEEYIEPVYGYVTRIEVIDGMCRLILKRSVTDNGLSAYHLGSKYEFYPECREQIKRTAIDAMRILQIESGSLDIIENETGYYIIDANSVSNASEDNTEMFHFDLMLETAKYIVKKIKNSL